MGFLCENDALVGLEGLATYRPGGKVSSHAISVAVNDEPKSSNGMGSSVSVKSQAEYPPSLPEVGSGTGNGGGMSRTIDDFKYPSGLPTLAILVDRGICSRFSRSSWLCLCRSKSCGTLSKRISRTATHRFAEELRGSYRRRTSREWAQDRSIDCGEISAVMNGRRRAADKPVAAV